MSVRIKIVATSAAILAILAAAVGVWAHWQWDTEKELAGITGTTNPWRGCWPRWTSAPSSTSCSSTAS